MIRAQVHPQPKWRGYGYDARYVTEYSDRLYNKRYKDYKDSQDGEGLAGAVAVCRCPCEANEEVVFYVKDSLWETESHQVWTAQRRDDREAVVGRVQL